MAQIVNGADKMLLKISFDFIFPFKFQTIMIEIAIQIVSFSKFNYSLDLKYSLELQYQVFRVYNHQRKTTFLVQSFKMSVGNQNTYKLPY